MIVKRIIRAVSILTVIMSFIATAWANLTVEHASGKTSVPNNPKKVVFFDLASLDNVNRLGINAVVGVPEGKKPVYLQHFDDEKYEKIGTFFEPNYEKIAAFQPDLIIISSRTKSKYQDLSKIAPTIDLTVGYENALQNIERNINILGKIFGKEKEAEREIVTLRENLAMVRKSTEGKGKGLVLMTSGGKINALGPKSRIDIIHTNFGIVAATDKIVVHKHGQPISPEFILETNPDWLLVIDRDAAIGREGKSAAELLDNELVRRTTAGRKNQIIYLDSWSWYRASGGLTGLNEATKQISEAFTKSK